MEEVPDRTVDAGVPSDFCHLPLRFESLCLASQSSINVPSGWNAEHLCGEKAFG
jgi:hypothetical protein